MQRLSTTNTTTNADATSHHHYCFNHCHSSGAELSIHWRCTEILHDHNHQHKPNY
jgi:succinate dehydrogenase/fumarate reductase flavoprotein subunit